MSRQTSRFASAWGARVTQVVPALLLPLFAALLVLMSTSARSTITWRGDFETANLSQWTALQAKDPSRVAVRSDLVRQGRYAARFEVRSGDNNVAGSGSGERAHLYIGSSATGAVEGAEQYWAWSTYFPSNFDAPMGGWNSFVSFHHTGSTGQVNIQFSVWNRSKIGLRVLGGNYDSPLRKDLTLATFEKGRWYDFVFHVKWSSNPNVGFVEVWANGSRVVSKTITPTLYVGQGAYLKMGYYRAAYSGTTVVYHDGMRRGSSYDEVAAEFPGSAPAPPPPPSFEVSSSITDGMTLSGSTQWSASPSGQTASAVAFSVDGKTITTDTTSPYGTSLDTTGLANGSHTFRVDATASDGTKASASAVATVSNAVPDPLTVTQNLTSGQTVSGSVSWAASTFDREVSKVEFSVDGQLVASDGAAPYAVSYDTTRLADGAHTFTVKAYATDGSTASASANVNVANATNAPVPESGFLITDNVSSGQQLAGTHKWVAWPAGKPVSRVTFWVDGKKIANENHSPYEQVVDTRRYADGRHDFKAAALAKDGSEVSTSASVTIANTATAPSPAPTPPPPPPPSPGLTVSQSVANGQTLNGSVSWTASPGGQSVSRIEFWIDGSLKWTEKLSPYVYGGDGRTLETRDLTNGSHTLEVRAFGTDGSTAKASASVTISNTTAALVSSIKDGQTITGLVSWTIEPNGFSVSRIEFLIDGKLMWTERYAPWVYGGDGRQLDTRTLAKGAHVLEVRATGTDGRVRTLALRVTVA